MGIAPGDYRLVGWDMDTTGKKVIDEICQIAGYTPNSTYSQYVMPYKDLNPTAIKRHSMKVVTNGKFRVLRNSKTNEVRRQGRDTKYRRPSSRRGKREGFRAESADFNILEIKSANFLMFRVTYKLLPISNDREHFIINHRCRRNYF